MLKRLLKPIRKQLLRFNYVRRVVSNSIKRVKKERYSKNWAQRMHSGKTVHVVDSDSPVSTLHVDYLDGRMVGHRGVTPNFIRPFGIGRWKL